MPYKLEKVRYRGKVAYKVKDVFKNVVHAKHTTKGKAMKQVRLLEAVDHGLRPRRNK